MEPHNLLIKMCTSNGVAFPIHANVIYVKAKIVHTVEQQVGEHGNDR